MPIRIVHMLKWIIFAVGIFEMIINVLYAYYIGDKIRLFLKKDDEESLFDGKCDELNEESSPKPNRHIQKISEVDNINIQEAQKEDEMNFGDLNEDNLQ